MRDPRVNRLAVVGSISGMVGSLVLALVAAALHTSLTEAQFAVANPVGAVAMVLMTVALPVFYRSESQSFDSLARVGFGIMALGWVVTTATLVGFASGSGIAGLVFVPAVFIVLIGAFVFGVATLRHEAGGVPRFGAWLLVAALPIGLPLSVAFTWFVLGSIDGPWNGPLLFYALAWLVFSHHLWDQREVQTAQESVEL